VPTQAVAEYVTNVLGFDGLVYGSAQLGAVGDEADVGSEDERSRHNIALFGAAGTVESVEEPATTGGSLDVGARNEPGLRFKEGSFRVRRIQSITYVHNDHFVADLENQYGLSVEGFGGPRF